MPRNPGRGDPASKRGEESGGLLLSCWLTSPETADPAQCGASADPGRTLLGPRASGPTQRKREGRSVATFKPTLLLLHEGTNSLRKGRQRRLFMRLITITWPWQVPAAEALEEEVHLRAVRLFRFSRAISAHTENPYRRAQASYISSLVFLGCVWSPTNVVILCCSRFH